MKEIKELQKTLTTKYNLDWNFVYREWVEIVNPNPVEIQRCDKNVQEAKAHSAEVERRGKRTIKAPHVPHHNLFLLIKGGFMA